MLWAMKKVSAERDQREAWPSRKRITGLPPSLKPGTAPPWSLSMTCLSAGARGGDRPKGGHAWVGRMVGGVGCIISCVCAARRERIRAPHALKCSAHFGKSSSVMEPLGVTPRPMLHVSPSSASSSRSPAHSSSVGLRSGTSSPALRLAASFLASPPPRALMRNGAQALPSARVVIPSVTCFSILPSETISNRRRKPSSSNLLARMRARPVVVLVASSSKP